MSPCVCPVLFIKRKPTAELRKKIERLNGLKKFIGMDIVMSHKMLNQWQKIIVFAKSWSFA